MKSKLLVLLLILVMIFASAFGFTACFGSGGDDPGQETGGKEFTGVSLPDKTVTYDGSDKTGRMSVQGTTHSAEIVYEFKKDGVVVTEAKDAGEYTVTATLTKSGYQTKTLTATLTISKADIETAVMSDKVVDYNGTAQTMSVSGLPTGAQVSYEYKKDGAVVTEAKLPGVYQVTATITKANYNDKVITKTLTINALEFTDVSLSNKTVQYNGQAQTLDVVGAPSDATVSYEYRKDGAVVTEAIEAGVYQVTAVISKEGYNTKTLTKTLTITVQDFANTITFNDGEFTFDGQAKTLEVVGAPTGTTITYTCDGEAFEGAVNAGEYEITATLSKTGYNNKILIATLTINKATFEGLSFNDVNTVFNGEVKTVEVTGAPQGATVVYTCNGVAFDGAINAGTYEITATVSKENYEDFTDTATLTIAKAQFDVTFSDTSVDFDGEVKNILVEGAPQGATITYTCDGDVFEGATEVGEYEITAVITMDNYFDKEITATLTINSNTTFFDEVVFENDTVVYDGEVHTLEATNLPEDTTTEYTYKKDGATVDEAKDAGVYTVSVRLSNAGNVKTLTATLTISKATFEGLTLEDDTVDYNGEEQKLEVSGDLGDAEVTYTYEKDGVSVDSCVADGVYEVTAVVSLANYEDLTLTATLTISAIEFNVTFAEKATNYNGEVQTIEVVGAPAGTTIVYTLGGETFTGAIDAGTYEVTATLTREGYVTKELTATLTISKAEFDTTGLTFEDDEVTFDGTAKTLEIVGDLAGKGITANYAYKQGDDSISADDVVNAGTYTVIATLSKTGCNDVTWTATLTINKKELTVDTFLLQKKTASYSGEAILPKTVGEPDEGLTVEYSYELDGVAVDSAKEVGVYTVTATFVAPDEINYIVPDPVTNQIVINPKTLTLVFDNNGGTDGKLDVAFVQGGYEQSVIALSGVATGESVVPTISIVYKENAGADGTTHTGDLVDEGIYIITAEIEESGNYNFGFVSDAPVYTQTLEITIAKKTWTVTFKQDGQSDVTRSVKDFDALTDIPTPVGADGKLFYWDMTDVDLTSVTENITISAKSVDVIVDATPELVDMKSGSYTNYDLSTLIGATNLTAIDDIDTQGAFGTGKFYLTDIFGTKTEVTDITDFDLTSLTELSLYTLTKEYEIDGAERPLYSKTLDIFNSDLAPVWNKVTNLNDSVIVGNWANKTPLSAGDYVTVETIQGISYYKFTTPPGTQKWDEAQGKYVDDKFPYFNFSLKAVHTKEYYELYRGQGYKFSFVVKDNAPGGQIYFCSGTNMYGVIKANEWYTVEFTLEELLDEKWDWINDPFETYKANDAWANRTLVGLMSLTGSTKVGQDFWFGQFFMGNEVLTSYTDTEIVEIKDSGATDLDIKEYVSVENKAHLSDFEAKYDVIYRLVDVNGRAVVGTVIDATDVNNHVLWTLEAIVGTTVVYTGKFDVYDTTDALVWNTLSEENVGNAYIVASESSKMDVPLALTFMEKDGRETYMVPYQMQGAWNYRANIRPIHGKEFYNQFVGQGYFFTFEYFVECESTTRAFTQTYNISTTAATGINSALQNNNWNRVTVSFDTLLNKWDNIFVNYKNSTWSTRTNVYAMLYWYIENSSLGAKVYVSGFDIYKDTATVTTEYYLETGYGTGVYEKDNTKTVNSSIGVGLKAFANQIAVTGYAFDAENVDNVLSAVVTGDGATLKLYYNRLPSYTVEYYKETGFGTNEFGKADTKTLYAKLGETVNADTSIVFTNFTVITEGDTLSGVIEGDNELVLKVYYTQQPSYTVKFYKQTTFGVDGYTEDTLSAKTLYATLNTEVTYSVSSVPTSYELNEVKSVLEGTVDGNGTLVLEVYFDLTSNAIGMVEKNETTSVQVVKDTSAEYTYKVYQIVAGEDVEIDATGLITNGMLSTATLEGQYKIVATKTADSSTLTTTVEVYDKNAPVWNSDIANGMYVAKTNFVAGPSYNTPSAVTGYTIIDAADAVAGTDDLLVGKTGKFIKVVFDGSYTSANLLFNLFPVHSQEYYDGLVGQGYVVSYDAYSTVTARNNCFTGYTGPNNSTAGYYTLEGGVTYRGLGVTANGKQTYSLPIDSYVASLDARLFNFTASAMNLNKLTGSDDATVKAMGRFEIQTIASGDTMYIGNFRIEKMFDHIVMTEDDMTIDLDKAETFDLRNVLTEGQRAKLAVYQANATGSNKVKWTVVFADGTKYTVDTDKTEIPSIDVVDNIAKLQAGKVYITVQFAGYNGPDWRNNQIIKIGKLESNVPTKGITFTNFVEMGSLTTEYYLENDGGAFELDSNKTTVVSRKLGNVCANVIEIDGYHYDFGNENELAAGELTTDGLTLKVYYKKGATSALLVDTKGMDSYDLGASFEDGKQVWTDNGFDLTLTAVDFNGNEVLDTEIDTTVAENLGAYTVTLKYGNAVLYTGIIDIYNSDFAPAWDYTSEAGMARAQHVDWSGKKLITDKMAVETDGGIKYYTINNIAPKKAGTYTYEMFGLAPVHTKDYYELFRDQGYTFSYAFKSVTDTGAAPGGQIYFGDTVNRIQTNPLKNNTWITVSFTLEQVLDDHFDMFSNALQAYKDAGSPWGAKGHGLCSLTGSDMTSQKLYFGQFFITNETIPSIVDNTVHTVVDGTQAIDLMSFVSNGDMETIAPFLAKYSVIYRVTDPNGVCYVSDTAEVHPLAPNFNRLWKFEAIIGSTTIYTGYVDIYKTTENLVWNTISEENVSNANIVAADGSKVDVPLAVTFTEKDGREAYMVPYQMQGAWNYRANIRPIHGKAFYEQFAGQGYYFTFEYFVECESATKAVVQSYNLSTTPSTGINSGVQNNTWYRVTVPFDTLLAKWDNIFVNYGESTWGTRTNVYAMLYWYIENSNLGAKVYVSGFDVYKETATVTTEYYLETGYGTAVYEIDNEKTTQTPFGVGVKAFANQIAIADYTLDLSNENTVATGVVASDGLTLKLYYKDAIKALGIVDKATNPTIQVVSDVSGEYTYKLFLTSFGTDEEVDCTGLVEDGMLSIASLEGIYRVEATNTATGDVEKTTFETYNSLGVAVFNYVNDDMLGLNAVDFSAKKSANDKMSVVTVDGIKYYQEDTAGGAYFAFSMLPLHSKEYYELFRSKGYKLSYNVRIVAPAGQNFANAKTQVAGATAGAVKTISVTLEDLLDSRWDWIVNPLPTYADAVAADPNAWGNCIRGLIGLYSMINGSSASQIQFGQFILTNETFTPVVNGTAVTVVDSEDTELDIIAQVSQTDKEAVDAYVAKGYEVTWRVFDAYGELLDSTVVDATDSGYWMNYTVEAIVGATTVYTGYVDIYNADEECEPFWTEVVDGCEGTVFALNNDGSKKVASYEEFDGEYCYVVPYGSSSGRISVKPLHSKAFYAREEFKDYQFTYRYYVKTTKTDRLFVQAVDLNADTVLSTVENNTWVNVTVSMERLLSKWDNIFVNYANMEWGTRQQGFAMLYWYTGGVVDADAVVYIAGFEMSEA